MKLIFSALVSAVMVMASPAFAASHGGGKMDDKPDCTKKENAEKKECKKM
jgi:hypothetical protein